MQEGMVYEIDKLIKSNKNNLTDNILELNETLIYMSIGVEKEKIRKI